MRSEFPLPGLLGDAAMAVHDIRIVLGRGEVAIGVPVFSWPGRYGLQLAAARGEWLFTSARDGTFMVSRAGDEVRCFPECTSARTANDGAVPDAMVQLLLRRVLPRVAQLHGRTGLHGATIMFNTRDAFLLLGSSGTGKSTLSVALHQALGWSVSSDDISLLDANTAPARCFGVVAGACLWPDSLAALASHDMRSRELPAHDLKRWRELGGALSSQAALVRALIFLDQSLTATDISLRPLAVPPALVGVMRQLVRFNPRDDVALANEMKRMARLLETTPAFCLTYPRSYAALPAVAELLRTHFATHSSTTLIAKRGARP